MHQQSPTIGRQARNRSFDLLRILFAILVLLSHAFELTDGNRSREILTRLTHSPVTFGMLAVDGFFLLSGFLIIQSWEHNPDLLNFLRKRVLRIVPGYLVAVIVSTVAVGLFAPGTPHFFEKLIGVRFFRSILVLSFPATPPVLPGFSGRPYAIVNGSLWTIAYEFRCYLLVALAGLLGLFSKKRVWLGLTLLLLVAMGFPEFPDRIHWPTHFYPIIGDPTQDVRFIATYFIGTCFFLFRERIAFRSGLAAVAVAILVITVVFCSTLLELALVVAGGYLMFYAGESRTASGIRLGWLPDISYGIYLYGWPVECLWIWFHHGSPWVTFVAATAICSVLGWISWHFVERPMLKLKRKSTAPLPHS